MMGLNILRLVLTCFAVYRLAFGYSFDLNVTSQTGFNGAVASESEPCSHAGTAMLKKGGNAADSIVATALCVGVVGLYNSGIHGGGFALIRLPNNTYDMIDFREQAPGSASENMFVGNKWGSMIGGNASAVPGQLRGLDRILRKYGTMDWPTVTAPAIEVAEQGFIFGHDMQFLINWTRQNMQPADIEPNFWFEDPAWTPDFAPGGVPVKRGELIKRKRYAKTLRTIAQTNTTDFYNGSIARSMVQTIKKAGGNLTMQDLKDYSIVERTPRHVQYRGYNVTSTVAPSSGSVVLNILSVLNNYKDFFTPANMTDLSTHRMVEAMKFGYAYRNSFGDPGFVPNITDLEDVMLSHDRTQSIFHGIDDRYTHLNVSVYNPDHKWTPESVGTSHMVSADKSGLTISLTTTVNLPFGSQIMDPITGIVMNSQMDDFSTPNTTNDKGYIANPNNFIKPGKRPLSSIAPIIITRPDGQVAYVTGAAGGSHIPSTVLQSVMYALDQHRSPSGALAAPRLHHQLDPNVLEAPTSYNNETVKFLQDKEHVVERKDIESWAQAIGRSEKGEFTAASEPFQHESNAFAI
ncbi:gamma-glutamyltranspeptidase [Penicillium canescens]|uniref:Glutathione hydrolase n=1 Tax=Penicillium canescens TaxID=5083 RepID=A0AAD6ILS7_PENCN|nr:gamma-glutamyltranspeptidase [Penicillium canescens]KAJ5991631.1 gamma-glutamyltranspeptidase [Penicillium canescens]KAJ6049115.1 gamma-glutamyltranspeptidase [Penicillium canescens]KAJ6052912.1 gamma-glutamyltranspeptidase [Penicillium canescens]KAJ6063438.1 gamma-glutamyltranspeptidase [Penicillium canescens]KAJ6089198.1 gamma-glutamyltranspeptidase [Penicillium canescens]